MSIPNMLQASCTILLRLQAGALTMQSCQTIYFEAPTFTNMAML